MLSSDRQTDVLIPVLQEAERRGESGIQGGASCEKPRSTSIRRETEDEAEDKEAHFSLAANGPAAHVTTVTERARQAGAFQLSSERAGRSCDDGDRARRAGLRTELTTA